MVAFRQSMDKLRFYPYIGGQTKVNQVGKKTVLSSLYDFGLGDILIDDIRIGTQPAENLGAKFIDHQKHRQSKTLNMSTTQWLMIN